MPTCNVIKGVVYSEDNPKSLIGDPDHFQFQVLNWSVILRVRDGVLTTNAALFETPDHSGARKFQISWPVEIRNMPHRESCKWTEIIPYVVDALIQEEAKIANLELIELQTRGVKVS